MYRHFCFMKVRLVRPSEKEIEARLKKGNKSRVSNMLNFVLFERTTESKVRKLRAFRGWQLNYLIYRHKVPTGIMVLLKAGYSRSTRYRYKKRTGIQLPKYHYQSEVSPPDYVIKPKSTMEFAAETLEKYDEKYKELIDQEYDEEMEPYNIRELSIVFYYG